MSAKPLQPCSHRVTISANDEKFFCRHTSIHSNGSLVHAAICNTCPVRETICRNPRPIPAPDALNKLPSKFQMARNLAGSMKEFFKDGCRLVDDEEYERRMSICGGCEFLHGSRCMKCGCGLTFKARGQVFRCPIGKWAQSDKDEK